LGESVPSFGEALSSRVKRRWFVYLTMSVFYSLDVYLTLLIRGSGFIEESNPVNRLVLVTSGPEIWIVFRMAVLLVTTVALLCTFTLATIALARGGREGDINRVEEVILGSVMLFYALALVHNLVSITPSLPQWT